MNGDLYLYDTNALISLGDKILDNDKFYVTQISLQELENIKTSRNKSDDIKVKARNAVRILSDNTDKFEFVPYDNTARDVLVRRNLPETPDNMICACAETINDKVKFYTGDLCCRLIAENIFNLNVEKYNAKEDIYKGYKEICGTTDEINSAMEIIYDNGFDGWSMNEYLLIKNKDDGSEKEMRFDGNQFVNLKLPPSKYIKAKNSLQRCALDMLNNQDITICAILGGYGSGKSFLSIRMGLYNVLEKGNQSQILLVREIVGEGKDIGALPGSELEKTNPFFTCIAQQLDGGEFELESLRQRGVIDSNVPYYMKGTTYPSTIMLCDEAEDFTEKQMRLIGTRVGEGSRIFLAGDYKQSVINSSEDNALIKMCQQLKGNKLFGCIYLDEDVRSSTSKLFAYLYE